MTDGQWWYIPQFSEFTWKLFHNEFSIHTYRYFSFLFFSLPFHFMSVNFIFEMTAKIWRKKRLKNCIVNFNLMSVEMCKRPPHWYILYMRYTIVYQFSILSFNSVSMSSAKNVQFTSTRELKSNGMRMILSRNISESLRKFCRKKSFFSVLFCVAPKSQTYHILHDKCGGFNFTLIVKCCKISLVYMNPLIQLKFQFPQTLCESIKL